MSMQSFRVPQPSTVSFIPIMVGGEESGNEEVFDELKETYQSIARRAYELYENREHEDGHGISDWLRAELELLIPVRVVIEDSPRQVTVRALVVSLDEDEVLVHVEPNRVIIHSADPAVGEGADPDPDEGHHSPYKLLHVVDLPSQVDPESARLMLDDGLLEVRLWKSLIF
ncbi:MAG TPA: DUF2934 domain-containing protein [Blastocatellia bacterium]|nr:DUF2934 domain-containing protein [Blastocatellia bacterium]